MGAARKYDLDHRLEAYFATLRSSSLRSSSLKDALKRSAANWQLYATVTGSAMAMATSASAAIIHGGSQDITADTNPGILTAKQRLASTNTPFVNALRLAMAGQKSGESAANPAIGHTSVTQAPSISPGGVVPLFGTTNTIQPGEWVSIYGTNLASGNAFWNGDFPTSLGGTTVEINGKLAYLMFVSPGQINLQAPDDTATGTVPVVVTTASGSATSTVTLSQFAPSFGLLSTPKNVTAEFVSGIILRSNGSGANGGGTYDILGPGGNSLGYSTVPAQAGDVVEIFGYGFGPTTPAVPAGKPFSDAAPVSNPFTLTINNVLVTPSFVGLSSAGVYQINLTVPSGLGGGDVIIRASVGGLQTQPNVFFPLQNVAAPPVNSVSSPPPPNGTGIVIGGGSFGSFGGGSAGGSGGGSGGGGSIRKPGGKKKPYEPRLRFAPE
jgi:uncharacterized protein (TIGR03437 family)